ncbi:hypothetical protein SODG_001463 [Sodalis praecaptivus]
MASAVEPEIKIAEEVVQTEDNVVEMKKTKGAKLTLISEAPKRRRSSPSWVLISISGTVGFILLSANKMR